MLAALIICAICGLTIGINIGTAKLFEYRISRIPIARKAVRYRRLYNIFRLLFIILFVGICVIYFRIFGDVLLSMDTKMAAWVLLSIFGLIFVTLASLRLPVSTCTKDEIKDKEFVIYLRGFVNDNYDISGDTHKFLSYFSMRNIINPTSKKETRPEDLPFSEEKLAKAFGKKMQVYCVGQPKDVYSPHGCKRVYLDHASWKEDVVELIKRAKYVFIHLHNTANCQWEVIECATQVPEKTIFLVEDLLSYDEMSTAMEDRFPEMLASQKQEITDVHTGILSDLVPSLKQEIQEFADALDKSKNLNDEQKEALFSVFIKSKIKIHGAVYQKNGKTIMTRYRNTIPGLQMVIADLQS